MNIPAIILGHRFGICASISIAAIFWLLTGTVAHCWSVGDGIGSLRCKSDILITFLIEQQRWPYMHTPFLGYWESYDNKLAAVIFEPYSQFAIAAIISYLVWLRAVLFITRRYKAFGSVRIDGRTTRIS